jgi:hypothetical protein
MKMPKMLKIERQVYASASASSMYKVRQHQHAKDRWGRLQTCVIKLSKIIQSRKINKKGTTSQ